MITQQMLQDLANEIQANLKADFKKVFLSGNLRDTIRIVNTGNAVQIEIPAEMYDVNQFMQNQVIVFTGQGSYASEVDITGGFSGKHKNYVQRAINKAINVWLKKHNLKGRVK